MVKYFFTQVEIENTWDLVFYAFWLRYPNPFSTHVLTEDVVYREVTADQRLLSRRLFTKTNRLPRWAERLFPSNLSRSVHIVEDTIVDPGNKTLITFTRNLNHTLLMTVEERCMFCQDPERPTWTRIKREAWIFSGVYGLSRPIQEFGLARFRNNQAEAMKGLEHALSNLIVKSDDDDDVDGLHPSCSTFLHSARASRAGPKSAHTDICLGDSAQWVHRDTAQEATTEKTKDRASAASPPKPRHFV